VTIKFFKVILKLDEDEDEEEEEDEKEAEDDENDEDDEDEDVQCNITNMTLFTVMTHNNILT